MSLQRRCHIAPCRVHKERTGKEMSWCQRWVYPLAPTSCPSSCSPNPAACPPAAHRLPPTNPSTLKPGEDGNRCFLLFLTGLFWCSIQVWADSLCWAALPSMAVCYASVWICLFLKWVLWRSRAQSGNVFISSLNHIHLKETNRAVSGERHSLGFTRYRKTYWELCYY